MAARHVLVFGSSGSLGKVIVSSLKAKNWIVTGADFRSNDLVNHRIMLDSSHGKQEAFDLLDKNLTKILEGRKLSAIINVAGGWAGGAIDSGLFSTVDLMMKQSLDSSLIATRLASLHLEAGGLLLMTGAAGALDKTPGMIGYSLAKTAVHTLITLASDEHSGLAPGTRVIGMCPEILDTPMNRKMMPDQAEKGNWTPLDDVASKIEEWADGAGQNGGIYRVSTKAGDTKWTLVE